MLIVHSIKDITDAGYTVDEFIAQFVIEALNKGYDVFVNDRKQLVARDKSTEETKILAVFG